MVGLQVRCSISARDVLDPIAREASMVGSVFGAWRIAFLSFAPEDTIHRLRRLENGKVSYVVFLDLVGVGAHRVLGDAG